MSLDDLKLWLFLPVMLVDMMIHPKAWDEFFRDTDPLY